MDFEAQLKAYVMQVERGIDAHVPQADAHPSRLHTAMRYSLQAGGKRLRPVLVLAAAELFRAQSDQARASSGPPASEGPARSGAASAPANPVRPDPVPAAVAVECIHTYSLIHDDLPCMDNDDLRRGRPTAHKAFDEATALLAGDALLTHAFALLATAYAAQPKLAQSLVAELADAAGSRRLIGGQMEDLLAEKKADATAEELEFIHLNKTAAMIEASLVMGARIGGATEGEAARLRGVGRDLGLAFQILDDVLDATADSATLGKTAGKDAKAGKTTYVKVHGLDKSRAMIKTLTERALANLRSLPGATDFLDQLFSSMAARTH